MEHLINTYFGFQNAILKADKTDPSIIYLEASNEIPDSDDELVIMKALKDEAEEFLRKGIISYDHLHKIEKNPKYIIGEPLDVKFTENNVTLVKAKLYQSKEYAQEILKLIADESTRLGASIGGAIVSKSKGYSKRAGGVIPIIDKIKWDEVAITYKPVNADTLGKCSFLPFKEFSKSFLVQTSEEIAKAMEAGAGVNAGAFTGGKALIPESIGKQTVKKGFWVDVLKNIMSGRIVDYNSLRTYLCNMSDNDVLKIASIVVKNKDRIIGN